MPKDWSKYRVDFFGLDSNFLRDVKIKRLRRQYGCNGVCIYLATICKMYETNGYFAEYDDNFVYDIADEISGKHSPTKDVVRAVIEYCIEQGLLQSPRHDSCKIITAHRVQVQFYLATKQRKSIEVDRAIWLLSKEEMEKLGADSPIYHFFISADKNGINVSKNEVFAGNNPQSKRESNSNTHTLSAPAGACENMPKYRCILSHIIVAFSFSSQQTSQTA